MRHRSSPWCSRSSRFWSDSVRARLPRASTSTMARAVAAVAAASYGSVYLRAIVSPANVTASVAPETETVRRTRTILPHARYSASPVGAHA